MTHETPNRVVIGRSPHGHIIETDPVLVWRACRAIRMRRDHETVIDARKAVAA